MCPRPNVWTYGLVILMAVPSYGETERALKKELAVFLHIIYMWRFITHLMDLMHHLFPVEWDALLSTVEP